MPESEDDFFELLAGREVPDVDPALARGVRHMRWAVQLRALNAGADTHAGAPSPSRLQELLDAVEAQGGFAPPVPRTAAAARWLQRMLREPAASFAVLATLVLTAGLFVALPRDDLADHQAEQLRGAPVHHLVASPDPERAQARLTGQLRTAGAQVLTTRAGEREWDLEVTWPAAAAPAVGRVLAAHGVPPARGGSLLLTVRPG